MGDAEDQPRPEASRLGSYEILHHLARGGMAELFLARSVGPQGFEKLVVLKKILPNYARNPKFVKLFLDEAKLAAGLDHPHIAQVYDMGMVDGHYFFTMEYVHGQDVRSTLKRTDRLNRSFPIEHAVQVARNVAAALHYAHERRRADGALLDIVHRDVSPSNILVSYDGAVKLLDFGVAKAASSTVKTRTGTLKGKIGYMSPEQAKGAPVDRRSDIFSLGIVLWEMLTTQRLFKSDNDLATLQKVINGDPQPPRELRPEIPQELERIVLRALARDVTVRYQTAQELQLDLEELAREHKLGQSTVALSAHMQALFDTEIRAWHKARSSGITFAEHVAGSVVDMTTPVSESSMEMLDEDDDDDDASVESGIPVTVALDPPRPTMQPAPRPQTIPPPRPSQPRLDRTPVPTPIAAVKSGPVVVATQERRDHTPIPQRVPREATYTPSSPMWVPTGSSPSGQQPIVSGTRPSGQQPVVPAGTRPSGPIPVSNPSGQIPVPIGPNPSGPIPMAIAPSPSGPVREPTFSVAPLAWRPAAETEDAPATIGLSPRFMRRAILGASGVAVVFLIIALAAGGGSDKKAPEPVETKPVETKPVETRPAEPLRIEPKPAEPRPVESTPAAISPTPPPTPPPVDRPVAKPIAKPIAKPPARPAKPTPKPERPRPPQKEYDPNSALPPPS